ncbi:MAG TPA: hypothetical protein VF188_13375 [Longimicrobiales bacterium]
MIERRSFRCLVLGFLACLTLACEGGAPVEEADVSADRRASGGARGSDPAAGVWQAGQSWRIEEVLRIGVLDGDGPDVLGKVDALEVDSDGDILIFDGFANELRVFSGAGVHRTTVGREGAGPGEFRNVVGMALGPGGDLWIVDSRNDRYTVLGSDGAVRTLHRTAQRNTRPWVGGFDREGRFYDLATEHVGGDLVDRMLRVGADGEVTATFPIPHIDEPITDLGGGGVSVAMPFAPRALRVWDPRGGVWQALSSEYRITNVRLDGDTAVVVSRAIEPVPLSAAQQDSVAAAARRIESGFGRTVADEARPTVISPLRWFVPDDEGRLWVCATGLEPCTELDVFDASGSFLGTVELPVPVLDLPLPVIRDGRLYVAVEGEQGAPQVFVGRIVVP